MVWSAALFRRFFWFFAKEQAKTDKTKAAEQRRTPKRPVTIVWSFSDSTICCPSNRECTPMNQEQVVQIVGPSDNSFLERLGRLLAAKLPYARFVPDRPESDAATVL